MKRLVLSFLLLIISFTLLSCGDDSIVIEDNTITYGVEGFSGAFKTDDVINPNAGFYSTRYISLKESGNDIDLSCSMSLYHLRVDLSAFSKANNESSDLSLTEDSLNALEEAFKIFKASKSMVIIRFAYDGFDGKSNCEPSLDMIKNHIENLSKIINKYSEIFMAVECGLIGPWGEMHTSDMANTSSFNSIIGCWIANISDLPILVRKPQFIIDYLGIDDVDSYTPEGEDLRLGVYNDGYYGTELDTGTYESLSQRESYTKLIEKLNNPFGGEIIGNPEDNFSLDDVISEMDRVGLTYLNSEWKTSVIDGFKKKSYDGMSLYTYILNHMGERLYITSIAVSSNDDLFNVSLTFANYGFKDYSGGLSLKLYSKSGDTTNSVELDLSTSLTAEFSIESSLSQELYLEAYDSVGRNYELINGSYENNLTYLGKIV